MGQYRATWTLFSTLQVLYLTYQLPEIIETHFTMPDTLSVIAIHNEMLCLGSARERGVVMILF